MASFLVTGGAGFLGTNLVRYLVRRGEQVTVVDDLSTGQLENLAAVREAVRFVEGDVRDEALMRKACQGVEFVIHLAAWRAVGRSIDDPVASHDHNLRGTLVVLQVAREAGVRRVVLASSSAVYGDTRGQQREDQLPRPQTPYAVAKLAGECYGQVFSRLYDLEVVALRYFNLYGPYARREALYPLVVPIFVEQLLKGERPEIHGDGEQRRDFIFVGDAVAATLRAAVSAQVRPGEVYNVGSGMTVTINTLYQRLQLALGTAVEPVYGVSRLGDAKQTWADMAKARDVLGLATPMSLVDGLHQSVAWYQQLLERTAA